MPSSSTNYSYDIPTVGSDSTTYGTIINQFVNSLATKLKTVSDKINTAGVGASSTLARINNYISQVNNINNRLPNGVANLLPDPYSGSLTPVSTWPFLNTELQAEGYSPPTTAQEVLDFDYTGFAAYLNTRFDSLAARVLGLDAAISIHDTDRLVCETNTILDAIGTYQSVEKTTTTTIKIITEVLDLYSWKAPFQETTNIFSPDAERLANTLYEAGVGEWTGSDAEKNRQFRAVIRATDVIGKNAAGEQFDAGYYIQNSNNNIDVYWDLVLFKRYGYNIQYQGTVYTDALTLNYFPDNWAGASGSDGGNVFLKRIKLVQASGSATTTVTATVNVPTTINDVDLSGCS